MSDINLVIPLVITIFVLVYVVWQQRGWVNYLDKSSDRMIANAKEAWKYVAKAEAEVERLREERDQLLIDQRLEWPKCWRLTDDMELVQDMDIVPGMTVFWWNGFEDCEIEGPEVVKQLVYDGSENSLFVNDGEPGKHFFATRETAESLAPRAAEHRPIVERNKRIPIAWAKDRGQFVEPKEPANV